MRANLICLMMLFPFAGMSFPTATLEQRTLFNSLAQECLAFQRRPDVGLSGSIFLYRTCPAYVRLKGQAGLESLELVYGIYKRATRRELESRDLFPLLGVLAGVSLRVNFEEIPWNGAA